MYTSGRSFVLDVCKTDIESSLSSVFRLDQYLKYKKYLCLELPNALLWKGCVQKVCQSLFAATVSKNKQFTVR